MIFAKSKGERFWAGGAIGLALFGAGVAVFNILKYAIELRMDPYPWTNVTYNSRFYLQSYSWVILGLVVSAIAFALLWVLLSIAKQGKYQAKTSFVGCISGIVAGYLIVLFISHSIRIPYHDPDDLTSHNSREIGITLKAYYRDYGYFPVDLFAVPSVQSEGYMQDFPVSTYKRYRARDNSLIAANRELFAGDPRPAIGETGRFGPEGTSVVNLCLGYELGADLFPWWDAYPFRWNENYEKKKRRMVCAGNFVYIPLDAGGNPIRYDDKNEDKAADYFLAAFAYPNVNGDDVWTPTGDPNMPVKLTPDGIPDGVIYVLRGSEEIR